MGSLSRRQLMQSAGAAVAGSALLASNTQAGRKQPVKKVARKGNINQSIVNWCFSSYWKPEELIPLASQLVCKHTHGELGLAAAAGQHVMLSIPNASDGVQQTAAMMEDDILTDPLPIASQATWGLIEQPGLGVDVDEQKLEKYSELYREIGQFLPYGEDK